MDSSSVASRPAPAVLREYAPALIVAAALVPFVVARFGLTPRALIGAFVIVTLAVLALVDLRERRLPNRIVLPATAVVLVAQLAFYPERALEWILASLGAALFLLLPLLLYPGGMGMGDVKLALLVGAALGTGVIGCLLLASFAIAGVALFLLVRHGSAARTQALPFGPFLAGAAIVVLLL